MSELYLANVGEWFDEAVEWVLYSSPATIPFAALWGAVDDTVDRFDPDDYTFLPQPEEAVGYVEDVADRSVELARDAAEGIAEGARRAGRAVVAATAFAVLGGVVAVGGLMLARRAW